MNANIFIIGFFAVLGAFIIAVYYEIKHTYRDDDLWKK